MYIGIDVGGTNLVAGVVDEEHKIISTAKVRAAECPTAEIMIRSLVRICREVAAQADVRPEDIKYIGAGIPGAVDRRRGEILHTVNAPFHHTPFAQMFQREWGKTPIYLENDANCAALGEWMEGAARGCSSAMVVTLGTGVGGGYITHGRMAGGVNLTAMEIGHMVIEVGGQACTCGRQGCWEQYSSAPGLKRMTREEMVRCPDSMMWELCQGSLDQVGGRTAFQAARMGDAAAMRVTGRYIRYLGEGLTNLINIFQPELICLGGGVSNERDEDFLEPLRKIIEKLRFTKENPSQTRLVKAQLGNDAGVIGAALLGTLDYFGTENE